MHVHRQDPITYMDNVNDVGDEITRTECLSCEKPLGEFVATTTTAGLIIGSFVGFPVGTMVGGALGFVGGYVVGRIVQGVRASIDRNSGV